MLLTYVECDDPLVEIRLRSSVDWRCCSAQCRLEVLQRAVQTGGVAARSAD